MKNKFLNANNGLKTKFNASKVKKLFNITMNGKIIASGLTEKDANEKFFCLIEDYSNGYIYDNENETVFNEVDKRVVAEKGDDCVCAGDNIFEIVEEDEEEVI